MRRLLIAIACVTVASMIFSCVACVDTRSNCYCPGCRTHAGCWGIAIDRLQDAVDWATSW